ncbi:MAG: hypothetical protein KatS3mg121_1286 [Gammaproteobacteria bacterium]|nr:MAG: hypothetical protein KatS3mg121_1286 [Gammaproteobacteria bacterium]
MKVREKKPWPMRLMSESSEAPALAAAAGSACSRFPALSGPSFSSLRAQLAPKLIAQPSGETICFFIR